MKNKILIATGVVILLVVIAFAASRYLVSRLDGMGPGAEAPASTQEAPQDGRSEWKKFTNPAAGIAFEYPDGLRLTEGDDRMAWRVGSTDPGSVIATVSLPPDSQPNTNLSEAYLRIGKSSDPKAVADCYSPGVNAGQTATGTEVAVNGTSFMFFRESDAGAGNFYETSSYRTKKNGACYAAEITVHSTNLGNYPPEQGRTHFDNAKIQTLLLGVFETLRFL